MEKKLMAELRVKTMKALVSGVDILDLEPHIINEVMGLVLAGVPHKQIAEAIDDVILELASVA